MNTPFFLVSLIAVSARFSRNAAAVLLLSSVFSARWRTSWVLVMPAAMNPPRFLKMECDAGHPTSVVLWKRSVLTAVFADFFQCASENGHGDRFLAPYSSETRAGCLFEELRYSRFGLCAVPAHHPAHGIMRKECEDVDPG